MKIAVMAPFSGDYAALGNSVRDAVVLAAETWNERGGVAGLPIELVLEDSGCDYLRGRAAPKPGWRRSRVRRWRRMRDSLRRCGTNCHQRIRCRRSRRCRFARQGGYCFGSIADQPGIGGQWSDAGRRGRSPVQVFRMPLTDEGAGHRCRSTPASRSGQRVPQSYMLTTAPGRDASRQVSARHSRRLGERLSRLRRMIAVPWTSTRS